MLFSAGIEDTGDSAAVIPQRSGSDATRREDCTVERTLIVAARTVESDSVVSLELIDPDGRPLPSWRPGAHIDVVMPTGLVRQYSLCGPVDDPRRWRIAVLREAAGRGGSQWIHDHALQGAKLTIRGPRNHFQLVDAQRYVFVAGGIGITPILPMVEYVARQGAEWTLYYTGRTRSSMAFLGELISRHDHLVVVPRDEAGRLDVAAVLAAARGDTVVYCCGPAALIDAVRDAPTDASVHVERFSADPASSNLINEAFEVELAASSMTITVAPDVSILQAVRDAGVHVMSSCSAGTCGTCETPVLEGVVDHRDSVLDDEEKAANDTMMLCVSRARGTRLVLDL